MQQQCGGGEAAPVHVEIRRIIYLGCGTEPRAALLACHNVTAAGRDGFWCETDFGRSPTAAIAGAIASIIGNPFDGAVSRLPALVGIPRWRQEQQLL